MLPDDDGVLVEIGDICSTSTLGVLFEDHPSQVRVEKTFANGVGILLSVGVTMVSAVVAGPPTDRAFDSTSTDGGEINFERGAGSI